MFHWAEAALQDAADIGQAIAADAINTGARVGNAALTHPLDTLGMIGGAALMVGGAAIEVPGAALDANGIGAPLCRRRAPPRRPTPVAGADADRRRAQIPADFGQLEIPRPAGLRRNT